MQNSIKGALAAVVGGTLLLGGAGSLAFWSDTGAVDGADLASGTFTLSDAACGDGWTLDGDTALTSATRIVPGDVLTQVCSFDVTAIGDHLAADLAVVDASLTGEAALNTDLTATASYVVAGQPVAGSTVEIENGDVITATVSVTFKGTATNASQALDTRLNDITITATQSHP